MTMVPYDFDFWALALKLALGFICLVLQINLSGKGMLAPNSAIDQLQNYVLGGIVGGMIYNSAITPIQFLIVLLLWTLIVLGAKFGSNHVRLVKHVIDGEPIEVLRDGRLDVAQLARLGVSAHDLALKLRNSGATDMAKVRRAVLEQNGQLTVTMEGDDLTQFPIILDGQIDEYALELTGKNQEWLDDQLGRAGTTLRQVYMARYVNGQLHVSAFTD
ncbi:DUF421 domain-containing protein [Propionibacterium freudenreichii]|uniref:DUF421 domain-containing protein n=1 Tax=Propionibacterium freudenreichii TaxID=1744 RepID=UPI0021A50E61|nr:YetF domain-containing protein [Propionibacterium freudenreichii]MCT3014932.1 DUF421 domain-containing protein [Propionibacterium freudenreichii]MDK9611313.1 DUF421 domain-containing protein [Propionibacterium freudenreichii]MDK9621903.1 DUF421 domain-containing protein [Propionibacterium freudenreichii]MDK9623237.1 DUF421 domain-containing protein [Propionibacterium freudenreichii]